MIFSNKMNKQMIQIWDENNQKIYYKDIKKKKLIWKKMKLIFWDYLQILLQEIKIINMKEKL